MWVCTLRSSGSAARIAASRRSTASCAAVSDSSLRQLDVQRQLVAVVDRQPTHVVDLAYLGHGQGCRRGALAQVALGLRRLDVDDHVGVLERLLDALLDRVGDRVRLRHTAVSGDGDHEVDEVAPGGVAHPQPPHLDWDRERRQRGPDALLGLVRRAVHQHVDRLAREPQGGHDHQHGDEQRGERVRIRIAERHEHKTDQHGQRTGKVRAEVQRVSRQRGRRVALRGPVAQ